MSATKWTFAVGAMLIAGPVAAQQAPTSPAADAAPKPEKKTCRRIETTGSILGGEHECHTPTEWAAIRRANEAQRDRIIDRSNANSRN